MTLGRGAGISLVAASGTSAPRRCWHMPWGLRPARTTTGLCPCRQTRTTAPVSACTLPDEPAFVHVCICARLIQYMLACTLHVCHACMHAHNLSMARMHSRSCAFSRSSHRRAWSRPRQPPPLAVRPPPPFPSHKGAMARDAICRVVPYHRPCGTLGQGWYIHGLRVNVTYTPA